MHQVHDRRNWVNKVIRINRVHNRQSWDKAKLHIKENRVIKINKVHSHRKVVIRPCRVIWLIKARKAIITSQLIKANRRITVKRLHNELSKSN